MSADPDTLPRALAAWMQARGLSVRAAAKVVGVPHMTLYWWTTGKRPAALARPLLARALGVSEADLAAMIPDRHGRQSTQGAVP